MLISAETLRARHGTAIRRHCWMSASRSICRAAATCCRARRCTIRTRSIAGLPTLPRDKPIVVYCIFGFQVSGNAVTELRRRGYDARGLKGGIGAWHAIGGPTVPLDQTTYES